MRDFHWYHHAEVLTVILRYFTDFSTFGANYITIEVRPTLSATKV